MQRILGIDWGEERVGLALGDDGTCMASPLTTVKFVQDIVDIAKKEEVELVVVGKPTKLSGRDDYIDSYKKFCDDLEGRFEGKVVYYDERMTSKAADALSGSKKTKANRDEVAAMLILSDYLNSQKNGSNL